MSQPPISAATRLAAVIGAPVRQSLSPALHNAVFAERALDWRFVAFEVAAGGAADAIAAMHTLGIGGFAVTTPHKEQAARSVDEVDPAASALRSVNTVVLRDDGSTYGASTDGQGFVNCVSASGFDIAGQKVAIVGAGGAARSIVDALGRAGASDIAIINRTAASAHEAARLADSARVGHRDDIADAALIVNATSVGMGTDDSPIDSAMFDPRHTVADIVYHPIETSLLRAARAAGATAIDGLGMLVYQAVLQQGLWVGEQPSPELMRRAAEAELARRSG